MCVSPLFLVLCLELLRAETCANRRWRARSSRSFSRVEGRCGVTQGRGTTRRQQQQCLVLCGHILGDGAGAGLDEAEAEAADAGGRTSEHSTAAAGKRTWTPSVATRLRLPKEPLPTCSRPGAVIVMHRSSSPPFFCLSLAPGGARTTDVGRTACDAGLGEEEGKRRRYAEGGRLGRRMGRLCFPKSPRRDACPDWRWSSRGYEGVGVCDDTASASAASLFQAGSSISPGNRAPCWPPSPPNGGRACQIGTEH
jgi:hypothetical protein